MKKLFDGKYITVKNANPNHVTDYAYEIYLNSDIIFYRDLTGNWYFNYGVYETKIALIQREDINDFLIYLAEGEY